MSLFKAAVEQHWPHSLSINFSFLQCILIWSFSADPHAEPWQSSVWVMPPFLFAVLSAEWTGAHPRLSRAPRFLHLMMARPDCRERVFDLCFGAAGGLENGRQRVGSLANLHWAAANLELHVHCKKYSSLRVIKTFVLGQICRYFFEQ